MYIKILLYDWEYDLRSGYFRDFFSSEMHMIINSVSQQITIEVSTSHSTILIEIAAGLVDMFKNNEGYSFDVLGFGTAYNYVFTSKKDKIKIDVFDLMNKKVEESIFYDKMKFVHDYVQALKSYLKWSEHINPMIKDDETFKLIEQYMNNLENVITMK